jgi:hypothetical protein
LRPAGLVTAGAGVIALGLGTVFALQAMSKNDDSNSGCKGNTCTPEGAATRNDARSAGNVATGFMVVGGVLTVGGLAMFLFAPSSSPTTAPKTTGTASGLRLDPRFGTNEGSMTLRGTW